MDIQQTKHYIKIYNDTHITKIVEAHKWNDILAAMLPLPMRNDPTYQRELDTMTGPANLEDKNELEVQMGFSYCQVIGELIFTMTMCRPDILVATIKLAQHSNNPAKCHFQAVKAIMVYLYATKTTGIHFWRQQPNLDLPEASLPATVTALH